jgi:hypothetical protein
MLRWLWDLLFTRSQWTIIREVSLEHDDVTVGTRFILQNQWGNIKQKDVL